MRALCLAVLLGLLSAPSWALSLSEAEAKSAKLEAAGELAAARAALASQLEAHPDFYRLVLRWAYLSYRMGDYPAAERYYKRAEKLGPIEEAPLEGLMDVAAAMKSERWRAEARRLLALNPLHRGARLRLGYDDLASGRYKEAAEHYKRLLSADERDVDALTGLGWCDSYLGAYEKAFERFSQALKLDPGAAWAKTGLAALPRLLNWATSPYAAYIQYKGHPSKTTGWSVYVPLSLTWRDKLSGSLNLSKTHIGGVTPVEQTDWGISGSYAATEEWTVLAAFDQISNNDPVTDGGAALSLGANWLRPSPDGVRPYWTAGMYYSGSTYTGFQTSQFTPHLGLGWAGRGSLDLSVHHVTVSGTNEQQDALTVSGTLGPWKGWSLSAGGRFGRKHYPVDNWGTLVANTPDVYRGGWKLSLAWGSGDVSTYALYAHDDMATAPGGVGYTSSVIVGGLSVRLGGRQ